MGGKAALENPLQGLCFGQQHACHEACMRVCDEERKKGLSLRFCPALTSPSLPSSSPNRK